MDKEKGRKIRFIHWRSDFTPKGVEKSGPVEYLEKVSKEFSIPISKYDIEKIHNLNRKGMIKGYTLCVEMPDNEGEPAKRYAISACSTKDTFSRKFGVAESLERLISQIPIEETEGKQIVLENGRLFLIDYRELSRKGEAPFPPQRDIRCRLKNLSKKLGYKEGF